MEGRGLVRCSGCQRLLEMDLPIGIWNLLIINLPHKFIDFLPLLLPLLDSSKPYVVRGRLVCGNEEIEDIRSLISQYFPDGSDVVVDPRSEYSPNTKLCSVTIRSLHQLNNRRPQQITSSNS